MTIVESRKEPDPVVEAEAPKVARARKPLSSATPRIVRVALTALVVVVVAWAAYTIFEGPVAGAWYRNRQHQLASQLAASRPHTGAGAAIGIVQIPRLGINLVVADGDAPQQLRSGPGHRIDTPLPGDVGNSVIVGHRSAWGGPFAKLDQVHTGDLIVVQTENADLGPRNAVFKVVSVAPVGASDTAPFARSTDRRLTLVTGSGSQFSSDRLAVVAISGKAGHLAAPANGVRAETPAGSRLLNAEVLLALLCIGGALLLAFALRKRYTRTSVVVVVAPLLALGLLGLLLDLDLLAPALR